MRCLLLGADRAAETERAIEAVYADQSSRLIDDERYWAIQDTLYEKYGDAH